MTRKTLSLSVVCRGWGGGGKFHADVIVYIFVHLHGALRTEGYILDVN